MKNEKIEELENLERITKRGMWWIRLDRARNIVTEAYEQCKKDEREHWMNQLDNEHDQAIRTQILDEIISDIDEKVSKDWGNVTPAIRQIIQSKYKY